MAAAKSLSIKQVQEVFGVAHMTIHNWRKGTANKEALPAQETPTATGKLRTTFRVSDLKSWAKKHGVEFVVDPDALAVVTGAVKVASKRSAAKRGASH